MALAFIALALVLVSGSASFHMIVFLICVAGAGFAGAPLRLVLLRFSPALLMAGALLVLKTFMTQGEPVYSFTLFSWTLTATREGAAEGVLIASRIAGALSVIQFLAVITPAHQIFRSLLWFGFSKGWVEVAMLMYRYTFNLFETAAEMGAAQRVRLGFSSPSRSLSSLGSLAGAVLLRSIEQSQRSYESMTARGYRGNMPFDPMPPLRAGDIGVGAVSAMAISAIFILAG